MRAAAGRVRSAWALPGGGAQAGTRVAAAGGRCGPRGRREKWADVRFFCLWVGQVYRDIPEELRVLIEPVVESSGLELVDVMVARSGRLRLLRVTIDTPQGDGRVSVERCANVSREIETQLDAADDVTRFAYEKVSLVATVIADPSLRPDKVIVPVSVESAAYSGQPQDAASGRVQLIARTPVGYGKPLRYGDRIAATGRLSRPSVAS